MRVKINNEAYLCLYTIRNHEKSIFKGADSLGAKGDSPHKALMG